MKTLIHRSKGSVRYAFKDSIKLLENNKSKQSLIYLFFTYGTKRFKYSTGFKSCFAHWDFKKQRIKNISSLTNKDEVNSSLKKYEEELLEKYRELYNEYGEAVNNQMLKDELDIIVRKKKKEPTNEELDFIGVCNKFITDKGNSITPVTKRVYKQAITHLESYEKEKNVTLTFDIIDMNFYNSFKSYLEDGDFSLNTIGKHIKTLKSFMNYALIEGYTENIKFKSKDFKVVKEITTEIFLTEEEIAEMHKKDLSKNPEYERARDIFLIGCYTGQRISDYNKLSKDDIVTKDGIDYFKFRQHKNKKYNRIVMCPITKEIREIMDKRYNGLPPKKMSEPVMNRYLKKIGEILEFNELVKCEYTKGGKEVRKMIPKYDLISSHTARRSFCTNKYKKGMNIFDIMLFTGHSTEKEFYKYIRIKDEERAAHIAKSGFFNI
ncbi:site-specific integrase [Lutibacter sp. TH_r2]|uniref:site-specific integrase n=1 Tax=Lutibacter sp. TH_r2 TaxID=3082083 RepID=UPI002953CB55|nr:site-specific integrase [Lutibacter sp. TH_r2]MDV7187635.1 site-specific integrase [Lutibacter sp. TH_r2]